MERTNDSLRWWSAGLNKRQHWRASTSAVAASETRFRRELVVGCGRSRLAPVQTDVCTSQFRRRSRPSHSRQRLGSIQTPMRQASSQSTPFAAEKQTRGDAFSSLRDSLWLSNRLANVPHVKPLNQFAKRKYIAAMIRRNASRLPANGNVTSIAILHLSRKSMSLMPRSPFASP